MNPPADDAGSDPISAAEQDLETAAQALRDHTEERWVEIAESMLARVLATTRPSHPVRGKARAATFHVSEQVLTSYVLDAVGAIPGVEVDAMRIHSEQDRYTGIDIVITARYGLPLLPVADIIRQAARDRLVTLLGEQVPPISVSTMHVHVEDVTPGDPGSGSDF